VAGGAQLVEVSALASVELPELDALYIGGGFPETHAERLAANSVFRRSLRNAVEAGLPVYAECGGLMYLSRNLCMNEHVYPMVGVFPMDTVMEKRPQGLGYIRVEVAGPNPFYPQGAVITGHEFHYSSFHCAEASDASFAFRVLRGHGIDGQRDGICYRNALGTYVHVHALGEPLWAEAMVRKALEFGSLRREAVLNA
jgi:cobyrinic acid a,c-diamide synthase